MVKKIDTQSVERTVMQAGKKLDERQAVRLSRYVDLLARWNRKMNLVGPFTWDRILTDLVADSWHLADFLHALAIPPCPVTLDLGAGAGLPGIPLRCFWEKGTYFLVEPRQKRGVFMRQALRDMGLENTHVLSCGYQDIAANLLPVDLVLSRAFCSWKEFLGICGGLLSGNGRVIVMTSQSEPEENLPDWQLETLWSYPARGSRAFFWSFLRK